MKSGQNAEISHTNQMLPRRLQGVCKAHSDRYGPIESTQNTIKTPLTMGNKVNKIHAINVINLLHTRRNQIN